MKGLDTNVLVRYFTQDDPLQSVAAERCIETACTEEQPCLIHVVVLCELVWVLETAFGYSRDQIAEVLDLMLHTRQFLVQYVG
jgi:predicted nucleic-acid-binding protein